MFRGLDEVPGKGAPFVRSVPIEKAMHADTLIALRMNGGPLTRHHGYPRVLWFQDGSGRPPASG